MENLLHAYVQVSIICQLLRPFFFVKKGKKQKKDKSW